jgi:23S rRNA (cytidine1920-2'-O)/16S rRNA (cytidine1409-2'-O)-methyltransferase
MSFVSTGHQKKFPPMRCCAPSLQHPYVSRGGLKLAAALDHFRSNPIFDPRGRVCLDVGASTGGFTELLLARGARRIYAVDVGRGQLHRSLRARTEVLSMEGTDIAFSIRSDSPSVPTSWSST